MTELPPGTRLSWNAVALRVSLFVALAMLGGITARFLPVEGELPRAVIYSFLAGALANAIPVRLFEHGRLSDFGLEWSGAAGRDALLGLGYGLAAGFSVVGLMLLLDWARFEPAPADSPGAAAVVALLLLAGATGEEMMFHGYAFQLLVRYLGAFATILPVGIVFGALHAGNPNATALGVFNTVLFGIVLGYACYHSGALWLPIGIHFGWNLALPLAGANLSGITMRVTGYALEQHASFWLSGGAYGPEGSVLATAAAAVLFWKIARQRREDAEAD